MMDVSKICIALRYKSHGFCRH